MIRWYFLAAAVLLLDQATKWIVLDALDQDRSTEVLPFLSWTFACNTGAAFSMFQGYGWVFAVAAVAVSAFLIVEIWRMPAANRRPGAGSAKRGWLEGASYGLVLAGALGNLVDRLLHGCVVDFIHVHYGWFNFPVFNVADSAITVGAAGWIGLLVVDMFQRRTTPSDSA